jgi:hypothetical protein
MTRPWHQQVKRSSAAERTSEEGFLFDSKAELKRWNELKLLQKGGFIRELKRQVKMPLAFNGRPIVIRSKGFPNGRPCVYTADFTYLHVESNSVVFEEYKGHDDGESRFRRAVVEALYNIEITVTGPAAINTPRAA